MTDSPLASSPGVADPLARSIVAAPAARPPLAAAARRPDASPARNGFAAARRVLMLTHSYYETDARVARYARALAARGDSVEVLALQRAPGIPRRELIDGVELHRIQPRFRKDAHSPLGHLWPLLRFLAHSSWETSRRQLRAPYDLVHIHNIPDFLVFAAWLPRLRGASLILDIHDIVPEFYGSKFSSSAASPAILALRLLELLSARFAHHVIVSNDLWREKFARRTGTHDRCSVLINHVDASVFHPGLRTRRPDGRLIVIFPGGLQWHQGVDLALHAFRTVHAALPHAEFHLYGDGAMKPALVKLAHQLGLASCVRFHAPVATSEIARLMADADLGIVPKRADSFGNEAYSTKIMEFMSLGVPVVVSRTRIDQFYFNDSVVRFFASGDVPALAAAMLELLRDPSRRERQVAAALAYSRQHSWENRQSDYLSLVDRLTRAPSRHGN